MERRQCCFANLDHLDILGHITATLSHPVVAGESDHGGDLWGRA